MDIILIGQELLDPPSLSLIIGDSFHFNRIPQKLVSGPVTLFNYPFSSFASKPGKLNFLRVVLITPSHVLSLTLQEQ